jgi:2-dehydropantoate 2-reductase
LTRAKVTFDHILLTVKAHDTERACRELRAITSRRSLVISVQNGLGNVETIHRYFPPARVLQARVIFGVELKPGVITITVWADDIVIGETAKERLTARVEKIAAFWTASGLATRAVKDVRRHIWAKVIYNSALNPLASILGVHYGALTEHWGTHQFMEAVIHEAYRVARHRKIRLAPPGVQAYLRLFFGRLVPATYDHHPSMLQDLERRRPTEISALNGALVRLARKRRREAPVNRLLEAFFSGDKDAR